MSQYIKFYFVKCYHFVSIVSYNKFVYLEQVFMRIERSSINTKQNRNIITQKLYRIRCMSPAIGKRGLSATDITLKQLIQNHDVEST